MIKGWGTGYIDIYIFVSFFLLAFFFFRTDNL